MVPMTHADVNRRLRRCDSRESRLDAIAEMMLAVAEHPEMQDSRMNITLCPCSHDAVLRVGLPRPRLIGQRCPASPSPSLPSGSPSTLSRSICT